MKEPMTPEEIKIFHDLVRSDPQRCLGAANGWIADNPANPHAYFDRHLVWMRLGEPQRPIEDLSKVIALDPEPVAFHCRGEVYRHIGEYEKALEDFHAARPSIRQSGRTMPSGCCFKQIVTPVWGTRPRHWRVPLGCPTIFGFRA